MEENKIEKLIEVMKAERQGSLSAEWEYMVRNDTEFMTAYQALHPVCFYDRKYLKESFRELIAICILAHRGDVDSVKSHCKRLLGAGVVQEGEIVEALETTLLPGGANTLLTGIKGLLRAKAELEK